MNKPLLSIGMIIKNEIKYLERCLKSLEPLRQAIPCQLVIADTGSTDGSRAVAERYADILFDFAWIDDFSAARNAVLERCTGAWYLTIDADEWLDPNFSSLLDFFHSKEGKICEGTFVTQRNYMNLQNRGDYGDCLVPRMGKMRGNQLRYYGAIHETLWYCVNGEKVHLKNAKILSNVILHHDGYAGDDEQAKRAKGERNMKLLRQELEQHPDDLRCILECAQSAYEKEEKISYATRLFEAAEATDIRHPMLPSAYQNAILCAYIGERYDLVVQWLEKGLARLPDALYLCLDGNGYAALSAYRQENYRDVLRYGAKWYQALKRFDGGEGTDESWRISSQFYLVNEVWRFKMLLFMFESACHEKDWPQANLLLDRVYRISPVPSVLQMLIGIILSHEEHLSHVSQALLRLWNVCTEIDRSSEQDAASLRTKMIAVLILYSTGPRATPATLRAIAEMGKCDPGRSAQILLSFSPDEIAKLWNFMDDFSWTLPEAYLHTMDCRCPLPERFYRRTSEQQATLASVLSRRPSFFRTVLDWLVHSAPPQTPTELTWHLDLVTAALRTNRWEEDVPVGEELCAYYSSLSSTYLDNFYNPELLNEDDILALPGMHRHAWYVRQALAALEQGDELGYVRLLRSALDAAPAMKGMVDFLLEHKPKTAAQRQLEELAEQVRAILARYSPDDPAVIALKQSEAYQKVSNLLEQQAPSEVPQRDEDVPVSPAPLEEALAGSREEIAASCRQSIGRWGKEFALRRTRYWEKFPLWGRDEPDVANNLAAALSAHRADFRWLFDRVEDEQSRRILTAVVRSWRYYEVEPLDHVMDRTYDDYFDRSLLHCDENEVVADLGAYTGDTFLSYVKNYGSMNYRRYYCYEITKDSFDTLTRTTAPYPRVILRRKGVGAGPSVMTLDANADSSANTLVQGEADAPAADTVEVVSLDDDIAEPVTLIKMDIEGAEQSALRGCTRHIREDRPKLALSVYHNFEDLWKLARMVEELVPGYRFYLRYHGGNLWPSEITLLGIPN